MLGSCSAYAAFGSGEYCGYIEMDDVTVGNTAGEDHHPESRVVVAVAVRMSRSFCMRAVMKLY